MLSKSQARLFFLSGTLIFSCVFLYLTVDSMAKVPEQTKSSKITEDVKHGKEIFDHNNCMGCHTILGEGAYYAPELTKTYERRGEEWLKVFLKDPQAMYPGERKMVQYNFSDTEIEQLIAFFKWIGEMDLNGFPAKPDLAQPPTETPANGVTTANTMAVPPKFTALCTSCHQLNGQGNAVGPALDGVGNRFDQAYFEKWLADPQAIKPGTAMPKLPLSPEEINEIATYLASLK